VGLPVTILHLLTRSGQVAWAVSRFVLVPSLYRKPLPLSVRLRHAIEHLGGAWVKIGQALALRFDLLPPEYCSEFLKLLNEGRPFSHAIVRDLVRRELGRYPEELFAAFEARPLAVASIAQVHKAVSFDGMPLAVKIRRPSARAQFAADFILMRAISHLLFFVDKHGARTARAFIDEFRRWTLEELDFRSEARNAHRMSLFSEGDPIHVDARVRFDYSTESILTTEYLDGIPLLEIIRAVHQCDEQYLKNLETRGIKLPLVARNISWNLLNQMFRDGFFHADLHPANVVVFPRNVIGYFDFGIVGSISDDLRDSLQTFVRALFHENFDKAVTEVLRWSTPDTTTNIEHARRDMVLVCENYRYGSIGNAECRKPLQLTSGAIAEIMSAARRNRLVMSTDLILYFKALMTADSVVFELAPDYDAFSEADKFFSRSFKVDVKKLLRPERINRAALTFARRSSHLIEGLDDIRTASRTAEVRLDALQTRLVFYGFWACAFGIGAYVTYRLLRPVFAQKRLAEAAADGQADVRPEEPA